MITHTPSSFWLISQCSVPALRARPITSVMPERVRAGSAAVLDAQISATISEIIVGSIIIAWKKETQTVQ